MSDADASDQRLSPPSDASPAAPRSLRPRNRRRLWLFRLAAMTLIPATFLIALEGLLRLAGFGYSPRFFLTRHVGQQSVCVENSAFGRRFFPAGLAREPLPVSFPVHKSAKAFRIFVLGGSAAMGFPGSSFSFARILEVMLRERYPDREFEIINTAMTGINSHVVLPIARDCADHEPDLFLVYMGNNEVVGPFGASGVLGPASSSQGLIRANIAIKATRTGQLLTSLLERVTRSDQTPLAWDGMAMFLDSEMRSDDPRLRALRRLFERNVRDICEASRSAHAPVILCTVATNLRDCPPFGSLKSPDLTGARSIEWNRLFGEGTAREAAGETQAAAGLYAAAAVIDSARADLQFRLARCLLALDRPAEAREHYVLAREQDSLRFRADNAINDVLRRVASEGERLGIVLADVEAAFAQASPNGLPGDDLFYEHVHLKFEGNYLLAKTAFQSVQSLLAAADSTAAREPLSAEECGRRLAFTDWNRLNSLEAVALLFNRPPFSNQLDSERRVASSQSEMTRLKLALEAGGFDEAAAAYRQALLDRGDDFVLHMDYGFLLMSRRQWEPAAVQFSAVAAALPHHPAPHVMLANVRLGQGRLDDARAECEEALRLQPGFAQAADLQAALRAADRRSPRPSPVGARPASQGHQPAIQGLTELPGL